MGLLLLPGPGGGRPCAAVGLLEVAANEEEMAARWCSAKAAVQPGCFSMQEEREEREVRPSRGVGAACWIGRRECGC